jgi:hypothetical protein
LKKKARTMTMIARNMQFEIVVPTCIVEDNKRGIYHDEHKVQFLYNLKTHSTPHRFPPKTSRMRGERST